MDFSLFFAIDDALVFFYTFAFFYLISTGPFSSDSLSLTAIIPLEYFMSFIRDPLISFVMIHSEFASLIWHPFWLLCHLLYIMLLSIIHRDRGYEISRLFRMISVTYFGLMIIHTYALIDSYTFKSHIFTFIYTYAIPSMNISIFLYSVYYVVRYRSFRGPADNN